MEAVLRVTHVLLLGQYFVYTYMLVENLMLLFFFCQPMIFKD